MKDIVAYIGIILSVIGSMVVLYRLVEQQLQAYEQLLREILDSKVENLSERIADIINDVEDDNSALSEDLAALKREFEEMREYLSSPLLRRVSPYRNRKRSRDTRG